MSGGVSGSSDANHAQQQLNQDKAEQEKKQQEELAREVEAMEHVVQMYQLHTESAKSGSEKSKDDTTSEIGDGGLHQALQNLHSALVQIQSGYTDDIGSSSSSVLASGQSGSSKKFSNEVALAGMQAILDIAQSTVSGQASVGADGAHQANTKIVSEGINKLQKAILEKSNELKDNDPAGRIISYHFNPKIEASWSIFLSQNDNIKDSLEHASVSTNNFITSCKNYIHSPNDEAYDNIQGAFDSLRGSYNKAQDHIVKQGASVLNVGGACYIANVTLQQGVAAGKYPSDQAINDTVDAMVGFTHMQTQVDKHVTTLMGMQKNAAAAYQAAGVTKQGGGATPAADEMGLDLSLDADVDPTADVNLGASDPKAKAKSFSLKQFRMHPRNMMATLASIQVIGAMAFASAATTRSAAQNTKLQSGWNKLKTNLSSQLNTKLKGMKKYIDKLQTYASQLETYSSSSSGFVSDLKDIGLMGVGVLLAGVMLPLTLPICGIAGGIDAAVHDNSSDWGKPFEWVGDTFFVNPAKNLVGDDSPSDPSGYIDETQAKMNVANTQFKVESTQVQSITNIIQGEGTQAQQSAQNINTFTQISQQIINLLGSQWSKVTGGISA